MVVCGLKSQARADCAMEESAMELAPMSLSPDAPRLSAAGRRGAARHPRRPPSRPDRRPGARLRAGQSRHPAARAGRRFPAVLPAQSEAVPADRRLGAGRLARAGIGRQISTSAPTCRATGSGATARWSTSRTDIREILARRSGQLRHRLLVLLRGGADGAPASSCATSRAVATCRCIARPCDRAGRAVPRAAGGVDAADDAGRRHPRRADHHALSGRAWRAGAYRQAGSDRHCQIMPSPTRATRCRCGTTKFRCSGPAA